jgi:hypothetical protein
MRRARVSSLRPVTVAAVTGAVATDVAAADADADAAVAADVEAAATADAAVGADVAVAEAAAVAAFGSPACAFARDDGRTELRLITNNSRRSIRAPAGIR